MKNFKSIVLVFSIVLFASCEKNDTIKETSKSEGFGANVYMEAQSDILLAGNSFKMPVTYWLPNETIDSLSLRETKDSTIELSFKKIAGSSFVYSTLFVGNIDSNKVYEVYQHSEDNWSDAHYSYRLHADYNSNANMSAIYLEKFDQVNSYLMQEGANSDSIIDKLAFDYATQMTESQLHRSIVSVCTQEEFDALWGGLTDEAIDKLFLEVVRRNKNVDEMVQPYFPYEYATDMLSLSENKLLEIFATERPLTVLGNLQFDELTGDTIMLTKTPYYDSLTVKSLLSTYQLTSNGEVFAENSIDYEKVYDDDFNVDIDYSNAGEDSKSLLQGLFVDKYFVVDNSIFETYFSEEGTIHENKIVTVASDLKGLRQEKILGYKPKLKRIYTITLEFQVKGNDGVIGKSSAARFNIK